MHLISHKRVLPARDDTTRVGEPLHLSRSSVPPSLSLSSLRLLFSTLCAAAVSRGKERAGANDQGTMLQRAVGGKG